MSEAKEKFVQKVLTLIPTTKFDYRLQNAYFFFSKFVKKNIYSWDELIEKLEALNSDSYYLEKNKSIQRKYFIHRFGRVLGVVYYLVVPRKEKKQDKEIEKKLFEEYKDKNFFELLEMLNKKVRGFFQFRFGDIWIEPEISVIAHLITSRTDEIIIMRGEMLFPFNEKTKSLLCSNKLKFKGVRVIEEKVYLVFER